MSFTPTVRALFVGITYTQFSSSTDLGPIPYFHAKSVMTALLSKGLFNEEECLFLTDSINSVVSRVRYSAPTKGNVMTTLENMISNSSKDDVLLFYYCGHGGIETSNPTRYGYLKTLKDGSGNKAYDVIYDVDFQAVLSKLPDEVNFTIVLHASNSGAMFVKEGQKPSDYTGKGIALLSDTPGVTEGRLDISTVLRDDVVNVLDKEPKKWPTYDQTLAIMVDRCKQNPQNEETSNECQLFHDPTIDTSKCQFLRSAVDQDKI